MSAADEAERAEFMAQLRATKDRIVLLHDAGNAADDRLIVELKEFGDLLRAHKDGAK